MEGEEGFATFRFAPKDADGLLGPELIDQPGLACSASIKLVGWRGGKGATVVVHCCLLPRAVVRRVVVVVWTAWAAAKRTSWSTQVAPFSMAVVRA